MLGIEEYAKGFEEGYTYVLYRSKPDARTEQALDKTNLESIGYHDGYNYGEYLETTGQTMSVSREQLIAEIDKRHTKALKTYEEFLNFKNSYKEIQK